MSEIASLELCKELYELSGWQATDKSWYSHYGEIDCDFQQDDIGVYCSDKNTADIKGWVSSVPAYPLGYLLRKLPEKTVISKSYGTYGAWLSGQTDLSDWADNRTFSQADTPENATAKLAIELFKQDVLKRKAPNV